MKKGIIFDGALDASSAYDWFLDMKEFMASIGLGCTHIGIWCDYFQGKDIRTLKRCEKRYTEMMKSRNSEMGIELHHVREPFESLRDKLIGCNFSRVQNGFVNTDFISFDYDEELMDEHHITILEEIVKKYMDWRKKTVFLLDDTVESLDSYIFMRNEAAHKSLVIFNITEG